MESSPLGRLPAEIRNDIYELVLQQYLTVLLFANTDEDIAAKSTVNVRPLVALTETCKAVRSESLQIFYSINDFHFALGNLCGVPVGVKVTKAAEFSQWLAKLSTHKLESLRQVELNIGLFVPSAYNIWHFIRPFARFFKTRDIRVFISLSAAWVAQDSTTRTLSDCHVHLRIPVSDREGALRVVHERMQQHPMLSDSSKKRCLEKLEALVKEMDNI